MYCSWVHGQIELRHASRFTDHHEQEGFGGNRLTR